MKHYFNLNVKLNEMLEEDRKSRYGYISEGQIKKERLKLKKFGK
jgi:hypothetical protein